ncbi:Aspartate/glutamate/uridylate kinase [Usnea florida]
MKGHKHLSIVIKLGSSSIVHEKTHEPLLSILSLIVETAVALIKDGHRVVIVSSGAIAVGLRRMDVEKKPKYMPRIQALAAVGQCRLMSLWESLFAHLRQPVAQILLTRNDIADRTQYLNAQNTFTELLNMGVIPIVNENDTLAVSEIRQVEKFGDNDTLSAITAAMVQADYLFLMTDVDCLYDKNPRTHPDAQAIEVVEDASSVEADVSSAGSSLGRGGMSTKIVAARLATSAGVTTVITRSSNPGNIVNIVNYVQAQKAAVISSEISSDAATSAANTPLSNSISSLHIDALPVPPLHTRFLPDPFPIRDRSFWLLHGLAPRGTLYIDQGAHRALASKAGLLPAGIVDVEGQFGQQEAVRLVVVKRDLPMWSSAAHENSTDRGGVPVGAAVTPTEVGRALVNYSAAEIARIKGMKSSEIDAALGYADSEYVALRENVSLTKEKSRPVTPSASSGNVGPVTGDVVGSTRVGP